MHGRAGFVGTPRRREMCLLGSTPLRSLAIHPSHSESLGRAGFVGTPRRREMCLLGSTVNWAARLMAKAGPGAVLVDEATQARGGGREREKDRDSEPGREGERRERGGGGV